MEFSGYFLTKIFHPNIATNGEICVNALKKDWNPSLGLRHVLIVSLLATPFADVSAVRDLLELFSSFGVDFRWSDAC